jgi:PPOX class probable F420-dependent enzyme
MDQAERRDFVRTHRTAIFGYNRRHDGPAMTVVYYLTDPDSDDILVSTMNERQKAKSVRRDDKVSLCVLDEKWPLTYLQVYGTATIDDDLDAATELMRRIIVLMGEGQEVPEEKMATVRQMCADEQRVVVRITPYATFATPPRHTHSPDDIDTLTHWTSSSMPW